jgi:hypothetical protein
VPGYEASDWFGLGAPKNTPAEVIDKLAPAAAPVRRSGAKRRLESASNFAGRLLAVSDHMVIPLSCPPDARLAASYKQL